MDEHKITDRAEGAKGDPRITGRPSPDGRVAAPPVVVRPRRKWRWWMPAAIVVVMGGLIAYLQFGPPPTAAWDAAYQSFSTAAACVLTGLLLYMWFAFFSGFRWPIKLLLGGAGLVAIVAYFSLFTIYGSSGNMGWHIVPRWWTPPDRALPPLSQGTIDVGRDAAVRPGDFPQYLGPDRNAVVHGVSLDRDWAAHPPKEAWRKPIGAGWGAFAVVGELAISQEQRGDEELVVARDRKTGEPVWAHGNHVRFVDRTRMGGDGPRATPTVAGPFPGDSKIRVFVHGGTGILDCLDASTGKLLWSHDTLKESGEGNIEWGVSASPLIIDKLGLVVVSLGSGGAGGALAAYDVLSGERKWVGGTDKASYASPMLATLGGKPQIVSVNNGTVTGHDPADGKVLWSYDWNPQAPAKASQAPVLPGDRLLLTAGYGSPGVLLHVKQDGDRWTAEEEWTTNHMRTKFTTPVVRDHYAYGLDDGVLACIDLDDGGKLVWRARGGDFGHGQVLLVEDLLLVQGETSGELVLIEASPKGYHKLGVLHDFSGKTWNNPALAGNHLFVRNDQEAACYELATIEKVSEK
jgi:outer membrane protein assembly factor BamB